MEGEETQSSQRFKRGRHHTAQDVAKSAVVAGVKEEVVNQLLAQMEAGPPLDQEDMDDDTFADAHKVEPDEKWNNIDKRLQAQEIETARLQRRVARNDGSIEEISKELLKNNIRLIPTRPGMKPKEIHEADEKAQRAIKAGLGDNYNGILLAKFHLDVCVQEYTKQREVREQIDYALRGMSPGDKKYKIGFASDISKTKLSKPVFACVKALVESFKHSALETAYPAPEPPLFQKIFPNDGSTEFHIEYKGNVLIYGYTKNTEAAVDVTTLETIQVDAIQIEGSTFEECLGQNWNDTFPVNVAIKPLSGEPLPRAPLRNDKGAGKSLGKGPGESPPPAPPSSCSRKGAGKNTGKGPKLS